MTINYALIKDTLPVTVVKPTNKKSGLFLVFHIEYQNRFSLSKTWDWDDKHVYSLLDEQGNMNITSALSKDFGEKSTQVLENIQKQFSVDGTYCYRSVLLRYGFISSEVANLISLNAFESRRVSHDETLQIDMTEADKIRLVNRLVAVGKTSDLGAYVLGAGTVLKSATPTDDDDDDSDTTVVAS